MADPGWYPQQDGTQRYWDGTAWTNHIEETAVIPAYVPPSPEPSGAEKSAWFKTRTAIGVGALLIGVGIGGSMAGEDTSQADDLSKSVASLKATNEELEADVEELSNREPGISQDEVDQQISDAVKQAEAEAEAKRKESVAKAVAAERRKADARVAAAEEESSDDEPLGITGGTGGTDPRFDTCGDAKAAGYGSYQEGVDPEYDWYQDRDNDGVVCE